MSERPGLLRIAPQPSHTLRQPSPRARDYRRVFCFKQAGPARQSRRFVSHLAKLALAVLCGIREKLNLARRQILNHIAKNDALRNGQRFTVLSR